MVTCKISLYEMEKLNKVVRFFCGFLYVYLYFFFYFVWFSFIAHLIFWKLCLESQILKCLTSKIMPLSFFIHFISAGKYNCNVFLWILFSNSVTPIDLTAFPFKWKLKMIPQIWFCFLFLKNLFFWILLCTFIWTENARFCWVTFEGSLTVVNLFFGKF